MSGSNYKSYETHVGQAKRKVKCSKLSVGITLLGLPHIVKIASETLTNERLSSFQQEPCWEMPWEMDVMPNVNFALSSNSKDQLRDLYDYLNQKMITTIHTLDYSTLGDNLNRF